ncbi:LOW QUALITY PROTEIN: hypothetical protein KUTeg_023397 [Tegillarca granosa]|uniref:PiggyBac transposable element-derived protein domain-containing protein n=1 Tax=Tegillarca granosa TaxID=220873 RepID=A0ABQ9E716_TEGGR|nr:LOW QUALITY PROTEIN: hypothetical protein KUTeg_023397 [Tegillarca granosa]
MELSDSGDEFEGWEPEDAIEAQEKYDHDVSSVSSGDLTDSEPENESDSNDPDLNLIRDEWIRDTRGINIGQFTHQTGPNHCLTLDARPLEYFFLLMPEIFYEVVAHETNLYAEQKIRQNGPDPRWHLTTPEEIRAYIGINIMFGIKQLPRLWCYWSPDPRFGDTWISKIMPKTRAKQGGRQYGLGNDVVWELTEDYHNQNRHIYFDRLFSSVILAEHLNLVNTYVCGTIMQNRKGLPDSIKKAKLKKQGDIIQEQKGDMWWRYILWFLINLSIVNAYILFSESPKDPPPPKHYDHLMFRADVAEQLVAGFTSRKHRKGRRSKNLNVEVAAATLGAHKVVHVEGRKKVCRQCSKEGRRTPKGRFIETMFKSKVINGDESDISIPSEESESESEDEMIQTQDTGDSWSKQLKKPKIPCVFEEEVGATFELGPQKKEIDFFSKFFTTSIVEKLVTETNSYAEKMNSVAAKPDKKWVPTFVQEMMAFLGIHSFL